MRLVGYMPVPRKQRARMSAFADTVFPGLLVGDYVYELISSALQLGLKQEGPVAKSWAESIWRFYESGQLLRLDESLRTLPGDHRANSRRRIAAEIDSVLPFPISSFRDFYAFEAHVVNARKKRGLEMVPEWYDAPVFYFSNTAGIVGDGVPVKKPAETNELDYELEWGVVIGKEGGDISVEDADNHILGFTIINDWSMRDVQRHEMKVGLGPAKGKDFATSVGPWLVTPDELEDRVVDRTRGKRYDLAMEVFVNGERRGGGNTREMRWTFAELIAVASRNTTLKPGDLIGSGTVGTGCLTEFPDNTFPWLAPGDTVTMTVERLGRLENTISLA